MLKWALVFLIIAIISWLLGLSGVAIVSAGLAKIAFYTCISLSIISLIMHFAKGVVKFL